MRSWMVLMSMGALALGSAAACGGDDEGTGGGTSTGSGTGTGTGTESGTGTGTESGTGTGSGTPGGTGTGSGMPTLDCQTYCDTIQANCTDTNAQYLDNATCMSLCAALPVGTVDDTAGNTLGCRLYHAGVAGMMEPQLHCHHAGPLGVGTCGDSCEAFCAMNVLTCTDANAAYADANECETACAGFGDANAEVFNLEDINGDSLDCRMYHLQVSIADSDPAFHCPHTAEDGGGACTGTPQ